MRLNQDKPIYLGISNENIQVLDSNCKIHFQKLMITKLLCRSDYMFVRMSVWLQCRDAVRCEVTL